MEILGRDREKNFREGVGGKVFWLRKFLSDLVHNKLSTTPMNNICFVVSSTSQPGLALPAKKTTNHSSAGEGGRQAEEHNGF